MKQRTASLNGDPSECLPSLSKQDPDCVSSIELSTAATFKKQFNLFYGLWFWEWWLNCTETEIETERNKGATHIHMFHRNVIYHLLNNVLVHCCTMSHQVELLLANTS